MNLQPPLQSPDHPDPYCDTVPEMGRSRGGWLAKRRILVAQLDGANQRLSAMQRSGDDNDVVVQRRRVESIEAEIDAIDKGRRG